MSAVLEPNTFLDSHTKHIIDYLFSTVYLLRYHSVSVGRRPQETMAILFSLHKMIRRMECTLRSDTIEINKSFKF